MIYCNLLLFTPKKTVTVHSGSTESTADNIFLYIIKARQQDGQNF